MEYNKALKRFLYLLPFLVFIILVLIISRSETISDQVKSIVIPELEEATGQRVTIKDIHINLFPLFAEGEDLNLIDENRNTILSVKRAKVYIGLSRIFSKQIILQRIIIDAPRLSAQRTDLEKLVSNIRRYLEKERKDAYKAKVKVVDIQDSAIFLHDPQTGDSLAVKGLSGEFIEGEKQRIKASIKEFNIEKKGWPKIQCDMKMSAVIKDDKIEISSFNVSSYDSKLNADGFYAKGKGVLSTEVDLFVDSVKRMFNLQRRGEGRISAKGEVRFGEQLKPELRADKKQISLDSLRDAFLDLKINGDLYIQTLMEFLKVEERIEGFVTVKGKITGQLPDISGKAEARLQDGNLFGVDIDSLRCEITYQDGFMKFEKGSAELYNGTAQAEATIPLPVVDSFTLKVSVDNVDSSGALNLIGWDPGIPPGKLVEGELYTSGQEFSPAGWFLYRSLDKQSKDKSMLKTAGEKNVLDRIKDVKGNFSMERGILSFSQLSVGTSLTKLALQGTINLNNKTLRLKSMLTTQDISDLTLPYYTEVKGKADFSGEIEGSFENPRISGKMHGLDTSIEGYHVESVVSNFSYEKNLLNLRELVLRASEEIHTMNGRILFPDATELFDVEAPLYDLAASLKNAQFENTVRIFYKDFSAQGRLNADMKIKSKDKKIIVSGQATVGKSSVYALQFDTGSASFSYTPNEFMLKNVRILKGNSVLTGEGKIFSESAFSYSASLEKLSLQDFGMEKIPDDVILEIHSEGSGTFDNPVIKLTGKVTGGTFKGRNMGTGTLSAGIQNRKIMLNAALFNEKVKITGSGDFNDILPWTAEIDIQSGNYDFIISSILKDVPEDLNLNLDGHITMKGDRHNFRAAAEVEHLSLSLFEQSFTNYSPIRFTMNNRMLSLLSCAIKSGATSFSLQGSLEIGKEYDLSLNGSSSLAPLKGMSKKIGYLKGDAEFVFSLKGKWDEPEINGGMNLSNASFGLRDYPLYISSIDGYLYIDGDRIVLENLDGQVGGGDVRISGVLYLKKFNIKRFYVESTFGDISTNVSKDFNIKFSGKILYKGTPDDQSITGDIRIIRAQYKEMVEWRSWFLTVKTKEVQKTEMSALEKAQLNIRITGGETISIDNNIARAPVSIPGEMVVKGTLVNPVLFGRLESSDGYVYFRNNEFRLIYASADFADPNRIKPLISLTAETTVQGYNIRLSLEGQTDHFDLSLSSDPHLEEVDILSLLTVGQMGKQLQGLEGGIGAGAATSFITGKVQDVIEDRLRTITGLDRFQVEPHVSTETGEVEPRVTVSKRLIGNKLFLTYSNSVGSTKEQVIKIEYLLDKNISLIGMRDEKGALGGDVKFRFGFK